MAECFAAASEVRRIAAHGRGRIHDTFVVELRGTSGPRKLLLQRINERVFRNVDAVMENVARVCAHLSGKAAALGGADVQRRALQLVPTRDGRAYARDVDGSPYRAFVFIDGAHSLPEAARPEHARQAGRAFGELQRWLEDLPPPPLRETIAGFHDTEARLAQLADAVARDDLGRAGLVASDLSVVRAHALLATRFADALASGRLPTRVAHNDAKMDNVLFDDVRDEALCVVDLDTVMPGSWLHDFGDLARSVACGNAEDSPDPSSVKLRMPVLSALTEGYVREVAPALTEGEWELLPLAPSLIALELAARFLADHLSGDRYFKVMEPGQNLVRARVQLRVLQELERVRPELAGQLDRLRLQR